MQRRFTRHADTMESIAVGNANDHCRRGENIP